ncbi:lipopolysaccharide/colanic/teichoic acid biosynthesis glycosyltransferase [Halarchaeum solikamskense]|uniref:sugar transferase n=1 Tax=Halarchaeum nitratireducens TaxID=489913 RepID=UPI001B3ACB89|nr:sugar transferase [Halarchaeum solikamskense]MBP2249895.1 lipopolysaccharide/colanic/teichoic acid biosynthesis glycosyltransferase [Halarchaeum solikamskense]
MHDATHTRRALRIVGTTLLTALAVLIANAAPTQTALARLPGSRFVALSFGGVGLLARLGAALVVTVLVVHALRDPSARRPHETVAATLRALGAVALALAALGYFDVPYRLPRTTLVGAVAVLAVLLPAWFVALDRGRNRAEGTLVVGADPRQISAALEATARPVVGYASAVSWPSGPAADGQVDTDGGDDSVATTLAEHERLGGLSRLDDLLANADVDTVVPALPHADRAEFFGILDVCRRHGVDVSVPDEHGGVLLAEEEGDADRRGGFDRIDLEPWGVGARVGKRAFDVCFAALVLCATLPVFALAALAITIEDDGSVFYAQERTTLFGDTFDVYKFRTMRPESESATPGAGDDRVTRVGRLLRRTHVDELPQFWAVLRGRMSVVGPRAAWTAEEELLLAETGAWRKRWFVKPGLTGLAQLHEVSSETPAEKVRYDVEYIRRRSLALDASIVARQLWRVATEVGSLVRGV